SSKNLLKLQTSYLNTFLLMLRNLKVLLLAYLSVLNYLLKLTNHSSLSSTLVNRIPLKEQNKNPRIVDLSTFLGFFVALELYMSAKKDISYSFSLEFLIFNSIKR